MKNVLMLKDHLEHICRQRNLSFLVFVRTKEPEYCEGPRSGSVSECGKSCYKSGSSRVVLGMTEGIEASGWMIQGDGVNFTIGHLDYL